MQLRVDPPVLGNRLWFIKFSAQVPRYYTLLQRFWNEMSKGIFKTSDDELITLKSK